MTSQSDFFSAGDGILALREIKLNEAQPALQRLGPAPFPKGKFPIMGFLATLYEHVSQHVGAELQANEGDEYGR